MRQISIGIFRSPHLREQLGILVQPGAVSDSARTSDLESLPHRGGTEALARVDRDRDVGVPRDAEGLDVVRNRVAGLRTRQVEGAHAAVTVRDGQLGHLDRGGRGEAAKRADCDAYFDAGLGTSPLQPPDRGFQRLV